MAILTGVKQSKYILELKTKNNRLIWVEADESPVVENGKTVAIVGSLTEITQRKKLEEVLKEWKKHIDEYLTGGSFHPFEARMICADGIEKIVEIGFGAIENLYITTFVDVTERKRILKEVERNKILLNENEKLSKTGAWEYLAKNNEIYWTDGLYHIHDFDKDTVKDIFEESVNCYDEEDRKTIKKAFTNCIEKGEGYDLIFPFTSAKGIKKWIRTITTPVIEDKKLTGALGTVMDITEQIKNETRLKELNATKDKLFSLVSKLPCYQQ